jgi:hypothetical protein
MRVVIAPEAEGDVEDLPITVRARLDAAISRLEKWPEVSGAKPLRGSGRATTDFASATGA